MIAGLRDRLVTIVADFRSQTALRTCCSNLLQKDCVLLAQVPRFSETPTTGLLLDVPDITAPTSCRDLHSAGPGTLILYMPRTGLPSQSLYSNPLQKGCVLLAQVPHILTYP